MMRLLIALLLAAGLALAQHSVTLFWTDTVNPSGTTYSVYRSGAPCSGYVKISSGVAVKTYADTAVMSAYSYCYYVTAVLSALESGPSNIANATIPSDTTGGGTTSGKGKGHKGGGGTVKPKSPGATVTDTSPKVTVTAK